MSGAHPATLFQIARCQYRLGRKAEAHRAVRTALEMEPGFEDYLLAVGILKEREAVSLASRLEWELSLGATE